MAFGGLRPPTPQTVSGDVAVALYLVPNQLRLNRRQDRLAYGDAESQYGGVIQSSRSMDAMSRSMDCPDSTSATGVTFQRISAAPRPCRG